MKKILALILGLLVFTGVQAQYSATVYRPVIPVRVDRDVNIVADIKIPNEIQGAILNSVEVKIPEQYVGLISSVGLYYTGTSSMLPLQSNNMALTQGFAEVGGGQQVFKHPSYAICKQTIDNPGTTVRFKVASPLTIGENCYYISVVPKSGDLRRTFDLSVARVTINNQSVPITRSGSSVPYRLAVSIRDAGQDSVHTYRIPGIVTANDGSLVAVYDVRRNFNHDLQDNVQVGSSRSTDGGRTWEPMRLALDQRGKFGLPDGQNGVGDPSILVDPESGEIVTMGLWTSGIGGSRAWWGVRQGLEAQRGAAQILISRSNDNGQTWLPSENITSQIKHPDWYILLEGPGRGIVMRDGTYVFPFQYVDSARMPHATIVYSRDKGKTWKVGTSARSNTTEAQVVETQDGTLMLNMRDNRGGSRAVMTTTDLGATWAEHESSRKALREPVCMASLIEVPAAQNVLGKQLLIFSNPDHEKARRNITIKVSLDGGVTWLPENQLLLDEELGWGYSCLTMVDPETVGIIYESSASQLLFQAVPLKDIVKKME